MIGYHLFTILVSSGDLMKPTLLTRRAAFAMAALALAGLAASPIRADDGQTLALVRSPGADPVTLDRAALAALPVTKVTTSTIWTDGVREFTGVALADLVAAYGIEGSLLRATALNDYAVEIPIEDAARGAAIVAYLLDGSEMSVRDKGPFWVIYPYDSDPQFRTETIYSRSIWQLTRIEAIE